jgi:cation transport regulator ChaB
MASWENRMVQQLFNLARSFNRTLRVSNDFHGQMTEVNRLFKQDDTGLIMPILNFQIRAANVEMNFDANKTGIVSLFDDWKKEVNKNLNIDIPRGLRNINENYYRERWKSSLIVLRMIWENFHGYLMPMKIWVMDGSSIYVDNDDLSLDGNTYYLGEKNKGVVLKNTKTETVLVRKPFNQAYSLYPTPYLAMNGALKHKLRLEAIINHQNEMITTAFPYELMLKMGSDAAQARGQNPTETDLTNLMVQFQDLKSKIDQHPYSRGLAGAFPHDVKVEEFIPDFQKIMDESIIKPINRQILSAMGMIELKGFSSTREEAILNPKVLVEETVDAVQDYTELWDEIVELIKEKNSNKYSISDKIVVQPDVIKAFLTNDDKQMIRSWYDRGLVGDKSSLENTTGLLFERQVKERDRERKEKLDVRMYPRIVQNLENDVNDLSNENVPDDKKKNTPEVVNYKNAKQIQEDVDKANEAMDELDNELIEALGKVIEEELGEYLEAPYSKLSELPDLVKNNMGVRLQRIFMQVVNNALKNGDSEEIAFKKAWSAISKIARQNKSGKWILNKKD